MLATLIKPDGGDALVDGSSIVNDADGVRQKIGFLTSELKLEEFFTPNYLYDFFSELHGVPDDVRNKRKSEIFGLFGIEKFAEVKVADLSTGMKQKVSLAVSIVHDPDIIIFDEPTNGLDVLTARVVTDFIQALKERGKTIIVSTHIFSLIERVCDRVGIIINGKMIMCDTLENIKAGQSLEDRFFDVYKKELKRFFSDKRMAFSTLLMPGIMIFVLYNFMGDAINNMVTVDDDYVYHIECTNMPGSVKTIMDSAGITNEITDVDAGSAEKVKEKISDDESGII